MHLFVIALMTLVMVLAGSFPAAAQPAERYSFADGSLSWSTWTEHRKTSQGWAASAALYPSRLLGLVIDAGRYADLSLDYRMAGVRIRVPGVRVTPYAQFLVGRAPRDDFALQPGAGVDVHVHHYLAARPPTSKCRGTMARPTSRCGSRRDSSSASDDECARRCVREDSLR